MKTYIKDYYNRIIGSIDEDSSGKRTARDFYNRIVGTYDPKRNITRDFYNRIVSSGDILSTLIWDAENKMRAEKEARKKK